MLVAWFSAGHHVGLNPTQPRIAVLLVCPGRLTRSDDDLCLRAFDIGSGEHMLWFTWLMQYGGGIALATLALALIRLVRFPTGYRRSTSCAAVRFFSQLFCLVSAESSGL